MSQTAVQPPTPQGLPLDAQVKYLSLQAELELLAQQIRSNQGKGDGKH